MGLFGFPGSLLMAQVRQTVSGYLPGSCVIEAYAPVSDGAGGYSENWTPVAGGTVACRILPMNFGQVEVLALQEGVKAEFWFVIPYSAPYSIGNRLRDIGNGSVPSGGTAYNIRWQQDNVSNEAFIKFACSRDVTNG